MKLTIQLHKSEGSVTLSVGDVYVVIEYNVFFLEYSEIVKSPYKLYLKTVLRCICTLWHGMNVTSNQIGEALCCSKGDFFRDLFFFFFTLELRELYPSPIILTCTTSLLFWLILSKHAGCSAVIHLLALQKKIHTKQQQERGLGGKAATFFFCDMKHKMLNIAPLICVYYHNESTRYPVHLHRKREGCRNIHGMGYVSSIYNDFRTSMHASWSCALSISNGRRFLQLFLNCRLYCSCELINPGNQTLGITMQWWLHTHSGNGKRSSHMTHIISHSSNDTVSPSCCMDGRHCYPGRDHSNQDINVSSQG